MIEAGVVKLVQRNVEGNETILGLRFPGWLLGAPAVFLDRPSPAAVVTLTRCYLRRIPVTQFMGLIHSNPEFSLFLHRTLSLEIFEQLAHSAGLAHQTARERLEHLIYRSMKVVETVETGEGTRLHLPLKQDEIAQLLAISPSYLCKLLDQSEGEGVLSRKKGWLIVPDRDKLWHPEPNSSDG
ncbi:MAG: Crp/Fnr family transcriptional regulator [Acidobacteria bacterium]|nr:Crp/Fnr family transcriptional regulator [Acidobacteriota bacterium]MCI0719700.1 Crp/Fnr family transcriptional regulator [Acidobacteriota bacterium]